MQKNNWHPKIVEDYLVKYYKVIESRGAARVYLKAFFTTMNEDPARFLKKPKKEIVDAIQGYVEKIENRPSKTQNSMLSFLKKYLSRKGVTIPDNQWEEWRIRNGLVHGTHPTVRKKTPTPGDLKKILSYATGIRAKALFTLCASSGLRIDEALSLTWDRIDMDKRKIFIPGDESKGKYDRHTFFTPEAKELLELYKPERERSLQAMYKKSTFVREKFQRMGYEVVRKKRNPNDPGYYWHILKDGKELTKEEILKFETRVFPEDYVVVNKQWITLLKKAGPPYDEIDVNPKLKDIKYFYNIHCLRRFWFTQLMSDRTSEEFVNHMGGHHSLLNVSYKDYNAEVMVKKFKEEYDRHLGCLTIFEAGPGMAEVQEDLKAKDQQIKDLTERMKRFEELIDQKEHLLNLYSLQIKTKGKKGV